MQLSLSANILGDPNTHNVVNNGDYLLHKYIWHRNMVVKGYIYYTKSHFGVITCGHCLVSHNSYQLSITQDKFLSNENNKRWLIEHGVMKVSEEDVDADIIRTAIAKAASNEKVIVIGEDVVMMSY